MPPTHTDEASRACAPRWPDIGILVLSQYVGAVRHRSARRRTGRLGYLLKDRVADVGDFVDAVRRVGSGGTALDPEVVAQLLARSRRRDPLDRLTPREREVLGLMAEGRSNGAIAQLLVVSDGAVEKHVRSIFTKLDLAPTITTTDGCSPCCSGSVRHDYTPRTLTRDLTRTCRLDHRRQCVRGRGSPTAAFPPSSV
jgi:DNA-binding NarL/FixJ family response regulator